MEVKSRGDLAKYFNKLGFKIGAEIGVYAGDFAETLCKAIPGLKYYGIDPWVNGNVKNHVMYGKYDFAKKRLRPYNATLVRKTSMDALRSFPDGALDFVYIDANPKFDYVITDLLAWSKKVKKGGIIAGNNYNAANNSSVILAVDGYVKSHSLSLNVTSHPKEDVTWWFVKKWNT